MSEHDPFLPTPPTSPSPHTGFDEVQATLNSMLGALKQPVLRNEDLPFEAGVGQR